MNTGEKIYTQHADHTEWMSKLKFYTDEISILQGRLGEIASKNNQQDVLAQVEHFQNQLIVQKNNIDEISHTIKLDESAIEKEVNKNPVAVDHREMPSHSKEKEAVDAFEKNFNELRAEFKTFAAKWM
ncbi:MAG: hypothetical protein IPH32_12505 [Bacteroidetes bacterium]|jgi:hypothetical protein|nr:hypothetical protein [Bacteroidota bacterium]